MKVCIFGAGAIGGFLGVQLAGAGAQVSLVARGAHLIAMRSNGVCLQIDGGERIARLQCTDDPAELGAQDWLIITLKAHAIPDAIQSMRPLIGSHTSIVTASNGLPFWFFANESAKVGGGALQSIDPGGKQAKMLGAQRAVGCVVLPATEVIAPGIIRHVYGRKFPIGEPNGVRTARIEQLHDLFVAGGLEAPIRDDIRDEIWLKLWGNLCLNPIGALTCATLDRIVADQGTRAVCRTMMEEARAVGERLGLKLRIDAERRLDGAGALGAHRISMLQDVLHHRPMEVEALVGVVVELGRRTGIPTPSTDIVLALIRLRARVDATARGDRIDDAFATRCAVGAN